VFTFGLIISIGLYINARDREDALLRVEFNEHARLSVDAIQHGLQPSLAVIESLHGLFLTHDLVSEITFHTFASGLIQLHPELQALEWAPRVRDVQRATFEASTRAHSSASHTIRELIGGQLQRAQRRPEYVPVQYVEPTAGNEAAIGYDLASDVTRHSALVQARDTGHMATTAGVTLVQESAKQAGVLVVRPVYHPGFDDTPQQRERALRGYTIGVLRIGALVESRLRPLGELGVDLAIYDQPSPQGHQALLYRTPTSASLPLTDPNTPGAFSWRDTITLPHREWTVVAQPSRAFYAAHTNTYPWNVLLTGTALTLLAMLYVRGILTRTSKIEALMAEQAKAQERLRLSASVLRASGQGMMITTKALDIVEINPAFVETTGYSRAEALGRSPSMLKSGRHDVAFYQEMWHTLLRTGGWQGEIWNRRKDGQIYPEWLSIVAIIDHTGQTTHYAGIFSDVSSQQHIQERLHSLTYYDVLTGLPNRTLFRDRLENTMAVARREKTLVALYFLDLDRFKDINDTLGHSAGDELLKLVTERLERILRQSDTIARLGGDEFTLVTPISASPDAAGIIAEKLIGCFTRPFVLDGQELFITTSIGISLFPKDGDDQETLLQKADTAMYRAKDAGRNLYHFYEHAMSVRFQDRLDLESALRHALSRDEFRLLYQPKLDLRTGYISGVEALIRWQHPQRGLISPGTFLPVAEDSGLMAEIGQWVLREATQQARRWQLAGIKVQVSVNLSAQQITPDLVEQVHAIISAAQLPAHYLELEITESLMMGDVALSIEIISALSKMGIQISVDDFGTGYSSLSYLKRYSVAKLKIDKSFIDDVTTDEGDAQIATTIIAMAHNLKLIVIAEGVETQAQLDFLSAQGCDQVQGYLMHRPLPADEISAILARNPVAACITPPAS
jgi:diguanylate cyclase (GGDEF)-like protein/PAS domain S-box-containing protein